MDLSIVIVNYNSADHVINCIRSIKNSSMSMEYEIIVVDNASQNNDESNILHEFPEIRWAQMGYNAGFARANNKGIRMSLGTEILLLNADTIIKGNAIEEMYRKFKSQHHYIACGVQLLNTDGTHQHSGAKFVKGGTNILLPLPYLGNFIRFVAKTASVKQPNVFVVDQDQEVDWIIGACILTSKKHIDQAGLLDEDFFMYAEEIEWCARLRKLGPMILYSNIEIIHLGGGSSTEYYKMKQYDNSKDLWSNKARQIIVSQMLRVRRQWGLLWFLIVLLAYFIEIPIFFIGLLLENVLKVGKTSFQFSHFILYVKNIFTAIPYFIHILFNNHRFYKVI